MKYEIKGEPFSVLECALEKGEAIRCQKGGMVWMSPNMKMETSGGGIGGMFKKAISGENIFSNTYTAENGPGLIAFGMSFPGYIMPVDVSNMPIIAQKRAFIASQPDVNMDIAIQKKLGAGFFGGEGFIMQKFSGNGMVFLEVDGSCVEKELQAGEKIVVDTGNVAAMDASVSMDIEKVKGLGNVMLGGEGLFNTTLTGPGRVWLQTMPLSTFVMMLSELMPASK